jgi:hypothetical protein
MTYTDFPVKSYKGTKSIVISTVSWVGGKNPFLGWAYVAAAALFVLLAILGTIRHLLKPRCACCIASRTFMCSSSFQASGRHVAALLEPVRDRCMVKEGVCELHETRDYVPGLLRFLHVLLYLMTLSWFIAGSG